MKNRIHLDLRPSAGTRDEEVASPRPRRHAGRRPAHDDGTGWVVLADPEGNEFCILRSMDERGRPRPTASLSTGSRSHQLVRLRGPDGEVRVIRPPRAASREGRRRDGASLRAVVYCTVVIPEGSRATSTTIPTPEHGTSVDGPATRGTASARRGRELHGAVQRRLADDAAARCTRSTTTCRRVETEHQARCTGQRPAARRGSSGCELAETLGGHKQPECQAAATAAIVRRMTAIISHTGRSTAATPTSSPSGGSRCWSTSTSPDDPNEPGHDECWIQRPDGGHRCCSSRCPEDKRSRTGSTSTCARAPAPATRSSTARARPRRHPGRRPAQRRRHRLGRARRPGGQRVLHPAQPGEVGRRWSARLRSADVRGPAPVLSPTPT